MAFSFYEKEIERNSYIMAILGLLEACTGNNNQNNTRMGSFNV